MDAFLIEKFEKQGAERVDSATKKDDWGAEFATLDLLVQAVADVAWRLGVAQTMVEEIGREGEWVETRRLLRIAEANLGRLTVTPYGTSVIVR